MVVGNIFMVDISQPYFTYDILEAKESLLIASVVTATIWTGPSITYALYNLNYLKNIK